MLIREQFQVLESYISWEAKFNHNSYQGRFICQFVCSDIEVCLSWEASILAFTKGCKCNAIQLTRFLN
jgi:hypothetical protein